MACIWDDSSRVQAAIRKSRTFAEEKKVPITIERLAAFLGVGRIELLDEMDRSLDNDGEERKKVQALLRKTCAEAVASVVEFGLLKGNTPTMTMFYLKSNAGYSEKAEEEKLPDVYFYGEDRLD